MKLFHISSSLFCYFTLLLLLLHSIRNFHNLHLLPLPIPVGIPNTPNAMLKEMTLAMLAWPCHCGCSVTQKPSNIHSLTLYITLELVTKDHFSMTSIRTCSTTLCIKPKKFRRRFLVVCCCYDMIARLDKSNNMIRSCILTGGNSSYNVVLQTPCS